MRAQTTIEYTIIVAVVLLVVIGVVVMLNDARPVANTASSQADALKLEAFEIGVMSYRATAENFSITLVNNFPYDITITHVYVNGSSVTSGDFPLTLGSRAQATIRTTDVTVDPEQEFSFPLVFNYTDETGSYLLNKTGFIISGEGSYG